MGKCHHERKSRRLATHNYTWPRRYFITVQTKIKMDTPLFEVPELRRILTETWYGLPEQFPSIELDAFIIMPDHLHFILRLKRTAGLVKAPVLWDVVGAFKSYVIVKWLRYIKAADLESQYPGKFWQGSFIDSVVRNRRALIRIREYIRKNPEKLLEKQLQLQAWRKKQAKKEGRRGEMRA